MNTEKTINEAEGNAVLPHVSTRLLIEKHQNCIEVLEGIKHFESAIRLKKESINGFPGTFPELRRKYIHNVEIYRKCIERLTKRYYALLNGC